MLLMLGHISVETCTLLLLEIVFPFLQNVYLGSTIHNMSFSILCTIEYIYTYIRPV